MSLASPLSLNPRASIIPGGAAGMTRRWGLLSIGYILCISFVLVGSAVSIAMPVERPFPGTATGLSGGWIRIAEVAPEDMVTIKTVVRFESPELGSGTKIWLAGFSISRELPPTALALTITSGDGGWFSIPLRPSP